MGIIALNEVVEKEVYDRDELYAMCDRFVEGELFGFGSAGPFCVEFDKLNNGQQLEIIAFYYRWS